MSLSEPPDDDDGPRAVEIRDRGPTPSNAALARDRDDVMKAAEHSHARRTREVILPRLRGLGARKRPTC